MDEKHTEIKARVEQAYEKIKKSEELLEHLREECKHLETEMCTYSPRPGQFWEDTEICSICGEVVKWKENPQMIIWTATGRVDGEITTWAEGGCSTGLGGDQYDDLSQKEIEAFQHKQNNEG